MKCSELGTRNWELGVFSSALRVPRSEFKKVSSDKTIYQVALVDDTPTIHQLLEEILVDEWRMTSFYSCRDFWNYDKKLAFDVILLDVQFPGESGFDLLIKLKQDAKVKQIPVVMFTELGDLDHEKESFLLGANDFIAKPFKVGELLIRMKASILRTQELLMVALIDPLTELYNMRAFDKMATKEVEQAKRHKYPLTLSMIDLNTFKKVNDELGHAAGDEYLKTFSKTIRSVFNDGSSIFRYGGDEFIVLSPYQGQDQVKSKLNKLSEECGKNSDLKKLSWRGCAFGTAQYPEDGKDLTLLVKQADQEMYLNKRR